MIVFSKSLVVLKNISTGYIAGAGDGIVTVMSKPAARNIYLFDASNMSLERVVTSLPNGHYIFKGINPSKEYLVMARDHKKEMEPFAWDYVVPATDLTLSEQDALWSAWQTI